jgi:hypothetical protein
VLKFKKKFRRLKVKHKFSCLVFAGTIVHKFDFMLLHHNWRVTDVVMIRCAPDRTYCFLQNDTPKIRKVHTLLRSKQLSSADDSTLVYSRLYVKLKQDTQCMYKCKIGGAFVQPLLNWKSGKNYIF